MILKEETNILKHFHILEGEDCIMLSSWLDDHKYFGERGEDIVYL